MLKVLGFDNKYTKPPECVDIIRKHHEVFTAGALEARVRRTSAFRVPAGKTADYIVAYSLKKSYVI